MTPSNLSTIKAANICRQLSQEIIDAETLSQSGIYRSIIKEPVKIKEEDIPLRTLVIAFDVK